MLEVNQLCGFGAGRAAKDAAFTHSARLTAGSPNFAFGSVAFGAVDDTRHIVVTVATSRNSGTAQRPTVIVGGVTATFVNESLTGTEYSGIWIAYLPNGTAGTVNVNFPAGAPVYDSCGIGAFRLVGLDKSTPFAVANNAKGASGTTLATTLNVPGFGIAIGVVENFSNTTTTWTGITEAYDITDSSGAVQQRLATETARAVSVADLVAALPAALTAASWA